jgi:hypothetical protein
MIRVLFISFLMLFHIAFFAHKKDSLWHTHFGLKAMLVVPLNYGLHLKGYNSIVQPNLLPSYLVGLQYKGKKNFVAEFSFQSYEFALKMPVYRYDHYTHYPTTITEYYQTYTYKMYRFSPAIGFNLPLGKRHSINWLFGVALMTGDSKGLNIKTYSLHDSIESTETVRTNDAVQTAFFQDISYSFKINKYVNVVGALNSGLLRCDYKNRFGYPYNIKWQNLFSFNVGLLIKIYNKMGLRKNTK